MNEVHPKNCNQSVGRINNLLKKDFYIMKILYYNWIQFDNKDNIGGGVNIYQRNVIEYLINNTNYEVYFLSSGWKYNPFRFAPYIKQTDNIFKEKCKTFEIINSSIIAPAFWAHKNLKKYNIDEESYLLLKDFIQKYGPFDVIHFNNLEGVSINILKIKELYPKTKIIYSVHNYQIICPLVQYFNNQEQIICNDFKRGVSCLTCSTRNFNKEEYLIRTKEYIKSIVPVSICQRFDKIFDFALRFNNKLRYKKYLGTNKNCKAEIYEEYRNHNIYMLNKYVDSVLAVSERVRQIMLRHGVDSNKIFTSYIGTKFAENEIMRSVARKSIPFTIAYLGYEKIDKGYFFFIDALNKMNSELASKINVVLAVAGIHKENYESKLSHFNKVIVYNGYTHDKLQDILKEVNLGIVPVLWEDNLPQVAIEMVALGVPILCSDFGGASELCKSDLFKFKGGDEQDFLIKLGNFVSKPELLNGYWANHPPLMTMSRHISQLKKYYGEDSDA